jgi:hypothetical protein
MEIPQTPAFFVRLLNANRSWTRRETEAVGMWKIKKDLDVHKWLVKISDAGTARQYLVDGILSLEEAHGACPFCGNGYVNEPTTNRGVLNKSLENQQTLLVRAFEQAKEKNQLPLICNGKSYTRKPCHTQDACGILLMPLFADANNFSHQQYQQHLSNHVSTRKQVSTILWTV